MKLEPIQQQARISMLFKDEDTGKEYIVYVQYTGSVNIKEVGTENTQTYNGNDLENIIKVLKKRTENTFGLVDKVCKGESIISKNGFLF